MMTTVTRGKHNWRGTGGNNDDDDNYDEYNDDDNEDNDNAGIAQDEVSMGSMSMDRNEVSTARR